MGGKILDYEAKRIRNEGMKYIGRIFCMGVEDRSIIKIVRSITCPKRKERGMFDLLGGRFGRSCGGAACFLSTLFTSVLNGAVFGGSFEDVYVVIVEQNRLFFFPPG